MATKKGNENRGVPIVLTASRAEMSHYDYDPFIAFTCTFPHKIFRLMTEKHLKPIDDADGSTQFAAYGLRKVEALLVEAFGRDSVVVAHHDNLDRFVGPDTKIVGISVMDPMGMAFVSITYNSLIGMGGESLNSFEFKRIVNHPAIKKFKPKLIVGGAGVWQIRDCKTQEEYGIDCLFQGEGEKDLVPLFRKVLSGEKVPSYFVSSKPDYESGIPPILKSGTYGTVEIMRGCGRGCAFCTPTARARHSFPISQIMKDVKTSIDCGSRMIFVQSEDIFLYKCGKNFEPNTDAVVEMFKTVCEYPGVQEVYLSHASFAPVVKDPRIVQDTAPYLLEKASRVFLKEPYVTVEMGIETGSTRLMEKYMKGKALPYPASQWQEVVVNSTGIMNDARWYPLGSILTGWPGETEDDVIASIELIDKLKGMKIYLIPLVFVPMEEALLSKERSISLEHLTEYQWDFLLRCWRHNIDFWLEKDISKVISRGIFLGGYLTYLKRRHGRKITRPLMNLVGSKGFPVVGRTGGGCERGRCEVR